MNNGRCKGRKQKRKVREAYGGMMVVMPLGMVDDSRMSVEESPLGVCSYKIRPTI